MRSLRPRPVSLSLLLMLATIGLGLTVRFARLGLPPSVIKYGGSCMWALTIYWLVTTIRPAGNGILAGIASGLIATAVEFFKLYRLPAVDAFRLTLPGILLLGKYFSVFDIVAYWAAIAVGAAVDEALRREHQER